MSITFVDVDISGVVAALLLLKFEISLCRVTFVEQARPQLRTSVGTQHMSFLQQRIMFPSPPPYKRVLTKVQSILAARTYTIYELFTQMGCAACFLSSLRF